MRLLGEYCRKIWRVPALMVVCGGIMAVIFYLYGLPVESVLYGAILCMIAGLASFLWGWRSYKKRKEMLLYVQQNLFQALSALPEPADANEKIYRELLLETDRSRREAQADKSRLYGELTDYYTMWVHQIKTPISAMRLLLQEDESRNWEALSELFRIEQYVEMVLGYLRTENISSDMHLGSWSLDKIIREQIHKYARLFVRKRIGLEYEGVQVQVLTDAKWLGFVIGQILSNALKYTQKGKISIYLENEGEEPILVIEDTGPGIRKEDLPRIFERGFTGCNGREEVHSTGIGLYLSAKIMKNLGHGITAQSEVGKGTRICLTLGRDPLELY